MVISSSHTNKDTIFDYTKPNESKLEIWMWVWNVDSSAKGSDIVESTIVLYDDSIGATYWNDQMVPSFGYTRLSLKRLCKATNSKFTFIAKL